MNGLARFLALHLLLLAMVVSFRGPKGCAQAAAAKSLIVPGFTNDPDNPQPEECGRVQGHDHLFCTTINAAMDADMVVIRLHMPLDTDAPWTHELKSTVRSLPAVINSAREFRSTHRHTINITGTVHVTTPVTIFHVALSRLLCDASPCFHFEPAQVTPSGYQFIATYPIEIGLVNEDAQFITTTNDWGRFTIRGAYGEDPTSMIIHRRQGAALDMNATLEINDSGFTVTTAGATLNGDLDIRGIATFRTMESYVHTPGRGFLVPNRNLGVNCTLCFFNGKEMVEIIPTGTRFQCSRCHFSGNTGIIHSSYEFDLRFNTSFAIADVEYHGSLFNMPNIETSIPNLEVSNVKAESLVHTGRNFTVYGADFIHSEFRLGLFEEHVSSSSSGIYWEVDSAIFAACEFPSGLLRTTANLFNNDWNILKLTNITMRKVVFNGPMLTLQKGWVLEEDAGGIMTNAVYAPNGVLISMDSTFVTYSPDLSNKKRDWQSTHAIFGLEETLDVLVVDQAVCTEVTTFDTGKTVIGEEGVLSCDHDHGELAFTSELVLSGTLIVGSETGDPVQVLVGTNTTMDSPSSQLYLHNIAVHSTFGDDVVFEWGTVYISPQDGIRSIAGSMVTIGPNATLHFTVNGSLWEQSVFHTTNGWRIEGNIEVDWDPDVGTSPIPLLTSEGEIEFTGELISNDDDLEWFWEEHWEDGAALYVRLRQMPASVHDDAEVTEVGMEYFEWGWIVVGIMVALIVLIVALVVFYVMKRRGLRKKENPHPAPKEMTPRNQNHVYAHVPMLTNKKLEEFGEAVVKYDELEFGERLGSGSFGDVYEVACRGETIAAKLCSSSSENAIEEFIHEVKIMSQLPPHPNVVNFKGIAFSEMTNPILLIELCKGGPLKSYLQQKGSTLAPHEKKSIMLAIAEGMCHLANNGIVHRDLAARNVLLTSNNVPKVSDFGMSRVLEADEEGGQTKQNIGPARWMAPEALAREYSSKSDVWSYGCLVYEIMTDGLDPYHEEPDVIKVAHGIAYEGWTPGVPESVDGGLKLLMEQCWAEDLDERPTFENICEFLEQPFV